MYFLPCKELKSVSRYNYLRSPYFVRDEVQLLSHIAESTIG